MIEAVTCIAATHDARLVLLAASMCLVGAFSVMRLFSRALMAEGVSRFGWHLLGAVTLGTAVWCTHFIAILAHQPGVPVTFDPALTIVSLLVPILGAIPGLMLAGARAPGGPALLPAAGGIIIGGAIAAMHFTGMIAYRVDGIVTWSRLGVAFSILCAAVFSSAAFLLAARGGDAARTGWRALNLPAIGVLVVAVVSLHFSGMGAMRITPLVLSAQRMAPETETAMAMATALAGLIVIATGLFAHLIDTRSREDQVARLTHMAMTDALTGLPNRTAYRDTLEARAAHAEADDRRLAVIAIDLDRFKDINDTHGHAAGDAALVAMAGRLVAALGPSALLARIGGDEFAAVVPTPTRRSLEETITRLEAAVAEPVPVQGMALTLGASFGIARFPEDGTTASQLTARADLALYRAKAQPLVSHCFYDPSMDDAARERRALAAGLREALASGEGLSLHYQLQASVAHGGITGYEALLRWKHPERGMVSPAVFVPLAEETGLIPLLGTWVLRRACADAARWPHPWRVAVNISPLQLADAALPRLIAETLAETGLAPARLEVELTETAIVADEERALAIIRAIKALGVGVALDDFGTGYSSLKTLRSFPFDKIKLDRFFMAEIETSQEAKAVVRSVLALGKSLAIPVLAEGVETPEQLAILLQEGCDEAQGFLLGRPSPIVVPGPLAPAAQQPAGGADTPRAA